MEMPEILVYIMDFCWLLAPAEFTQPLSSIRIFVSQLGQDLCQ